MGLLYLFMLHSEEMRCETGDPQNGRDGDSSFLSCSLRLSVKGNRSFEGTVFPSSRRNSLANFYPIAMAMISQKT